MLVINNLEKIKGNFVSQWWIMDRPPIAHNGKYYHLSLSHINADNLNISIQIDREVKNTQIYVHMFLYERIGRKTGVGATWHERERGTLILNRTSIRTIDDFINTITPTIQMWTKK